LRSWSFEDKCVPKLELGNEDEGGRAIRIAAAVAIADVDFNYASSICTQAPLVPKL